MRRVVAGLLACSLFLAPFALAAEPVPEGYRVVERPRSGLVIGGAVMTGLAITALGYAVYRTGNPRESMCAADGDGCAKPLNEAPVVFAMSGVLAAIGVPLLVVGLTSKRRVLEQIAVVPTPGGFALTGTF